MHRELARTLRSGLHLFTGKPMKISEIPIGTIVMANDGHFYERVNEGFKFIVASWKPQPVPMPDAWMEQTGIMSIPDQS
jgi:hypothetical protein